MFGISLQGGTHHISISGFEIRGFKQKDGAGIEGWTKYEDGDFAQISHIIIHHNYIYDNYDGINIGAWAPPWRHNDITILSNEIYNNHYRGINLWWVSESTVAHNEILNNGGDWNGNGVFVEPADDYNGNGVTDGDGVTLVNVNNLEVEHNKIHGSYEVGLSINQGKDSKFSHNDVRNNRNLGIALFGWGTPTTGNKFAYNDARGNCSQDILCYLNWGSMVYGNTWIKNIYDDVSPDPLV
jgi:parallel beta-helix repeat protein